MSNHAMYHSLCNMSGIAWVVVLVWWWRWNISIMTKRKGRSRRGDPRPICVLHGRQKCTWHAPFGMYGFYADPTSGDGRRRQRKRVSAGTPRVWWGRWCGNTGWWSRRSRRGRITICGRRSWTRRFLRSMNFPGDFGYVWAFFPLGFRCRSLYFYAWSVDWLIAWQIDLLIHLLIGFLFDWSIDWSFKFFEILLFSSLVVFSFSWNRACMYCFNIPLMFD